MRLLIVTRGATGAGKSTFLEEMGLTPYTLSTDAFRLLLESPAIGTDNRLSITGRNNKKVFQLLREILERRMQNGDMTVVDATHSRREDFTVYVELANKYRYQIVCIDFGHVDRETLLLQNRKREEMKVVPDEVVEKFYSRILVSQVPNSVTVMSPSEFRTFFEACPLDFSQYQKIHHIGDIHGCQEVLGAYLKDGIRSDECYVFCGDYVDRGIQNAEVLEFLFSIMHLPNVFLLEGNHEIHLWNWAKGQVSFSKEFERHTRKELEEKGVSKKAAHSLCKSLHQFLFYTYHGKKVLVTHGGLSGIPTNLLTVSAKQLIGGVGDYETDIDDIFWKNTDEDTYQVHGHRNLPCHPTQVNDRCFNLEGKIEQGGALRVASLTKEGWEVTEIPNGVFSDRFSQKAQEIRFDHQGFLEELRANPLVREQRQKEKNISSFNFHRKVFYDQLWDAQNVKARGLFLNTETFEVVARSYEKFFNIGEREETKMESLQKTLVFPVDSFVKDNGFLGILGHDVQGDQLIIASKSTTSGPFQGYLEDILYQTVPKETVERMEQYMKTEGMSLVFEAIDPVRDPHMVKYDRPHLVLLDAIKRSPTFTKLPYEELVELASDFSLQVKERAHTFHTWEELEAWYHAVMSDHSNQLEGYVLEDAIGFMTKVKLPYYSFWKWMRRVKDQVAKGRDVGPQVDGHKEAEAFVRWLDTKEKDALLGTDIITLREQYEQSKR